MMIQSGARSPRKKKNKRRTLNEQAEEGAIAKASSRTATGEDEVIIEIIKVKNS